jgi:hypothetical protein
MVGQAAKSTLRYGLTAPGDRSSRRPPPRFAYQTVSSLRLARQPSDASTEGALAEHDSCAEVQV